MSRVPPLPGPLTSTERLEVGDVVQVATKLTERDTGREYWWRRFVVVTEVSGWGSGFMGLHLKLDPDMERDHRRFWLQSDPDDALDKPQVVTWLPPERWPQGINAIYMKLLTKGLFKL